jgi:glutamate dehydrogenase/leucine dehydrogenase
LLHDAGARIIAVADARGAVGNEHGLDIPLLQEYSRKQGSILGFERAERLDAETFLTTPCDILIPAALGGVIDAELAGKIDAKLVIEAANAPVTAGGDKVLRRREIPVLPDILVNAGGVIVSYFEWTQNLTAFRWKVEAVHQELRETLTRAYEETLRAKVHYKTDLRTAAYAIAINRVATAKRMRWLS